ncbi:hypothetical protein WJU23_02630 [Prosthecobacter sp. SYSU 5D2]|uniref:hypothetical protein n=1 Tax=Prosthecobacter sp. SYSU 5D2 TaxID=3134134 RepID=UPI0031FEA370
MTAALIHPNGFLSILCGELKSDPASIAALGHAVHAAGTELAIRAGTAPVKSITLNGHPLCLTLLSVPQGVLLMEHEESATAESLLAAAGSLLSQPAAAPASPPPAPPTGPFSLADALHATAP